MFRIAKKLLLAVLIVFVVIMGEDSIKAEEPVKKMNNQWYSMHITSSKGKTICYVEIDRSHLPSLVVSDTYESVKDISSGRGASLAINAGAWNDADEMDFTYTDGRWYSETKNAYVGDPLVMTKDGILHVCGYDGASVDSLKEMDPIFVATGYNGVIYDYTGYNWDWNEQRDRSFIGQLKNGDYVIGCMTGGFTYKDMWEFGKETWGDELRLLYNLDGGGSCGLTIEGNEIVKGRDVRSVIVF